jgi:hypothetical protein
VHAEGGATGAAGKGVEFAKLPSSEAEASGSAALASKVPADE